MQSSWTEVCGDCSFYQVKDRERRQYRPTPGGIEEAPAGSRRDRGSAEPKQKPRNGNGTGNSQNPNAAARRVKMAAKPPTAPPREERRQAKRSGSRRRPRGERRSRPTTCDAAISGGSRPRSGRRATRGSPTRAQGEAGQGRGRREPQDQKTAVFWLLRAAIGRSRAGATGHGGHPIRRSRPPRAVREAVRPSEALRSRPPPPA